MRTRHRFLAWMVFFLISAAVAVAEPFSVDLYLDNSTDKSLTFGMDDTLCLVGLPPIFYPADNAIWLEGPGDVTTALWDEDFSVLSTYIKKDANAAMWKLYAPKSMKITFKSHDLPAGAFLKIYKEVDGEDEAIAIVDGTVLNATTDTTYLIDYRKNAGTPPAMPCPPVRQFQMLSSAKSLSIDIDVPDGYYLGADTAVHTFGLIEDSDDWGEYKYFIDFDGDYGTFDAATKTLTMTDMTNVARIQFGYWFTDGTNSTEKSTVIVDVTQLMTTSLVKKTDAATGASITGDIVAVDPFAEEYDGTILTYRIDLNTASELTLMVDAPQVVTPGYDSYLVQYCLTETADALGEYVDIPAAGTSLNLLSLTQYLHLKVTLRGKCEPGLVAPMIAIDDDLVFLESVKFSLLVNGTLDIDGNGLISEEDAIMMYNFIALGGVDFPEFFDVDTITQGIDRTRVDGENALATLTSVPDFLDYDENGLISVEDAIMMYNFIALGGVYHPNHITENQIIQGIDALKVDAGTALENFKKYAY